MQTQFSVEKNISDVKLKLLKVTTAKIVQHHPFIKGCASLHAGTCRPTDHTSVKRRGWMHPSPVYGNSAVSCWSATNTELHRRQWSSQSQFLCIQTKAPDTGTVHTLSTPEVSEVAEVCKGLFSKKNSNYTFIYTFVFKNLKLHPLFLYICILCNNEKYKKLPPLPGFIKKIRKSRTETSGWSIEKVLRNN